MALAGGAIALASIAIPDMNRCQWRMLPKDFPPYPYPHGLNSGIRTRKQDMVNKILVP